MFNFSQIQPPTVGVLIQEHLSELKIENISAGEGTLFVAQEYVLRLSNRM